MPRNWRTNNVAKYFQCLSLDPFVSLWFLCWILGGRRENMFDCNRIPFAPIAFVLNKDSIPLFTVRRSILIIMIVPLNSTFCVAFLRTMIVLFWLLNLISFIPISTRTCPLLQVIMLSKMKGLNQLLLLHEYFSLLSLKRWLLVPLRSHLMLFMPVKLVRWELEMEAASSDGLPTRLLAALLQPAEEIG